MAKGKQGEQLTEERSALRTEYLPQDPDQFLPDHKEAQEYYQALEEKHFSDQAVGSRFLEDTLESLLQKMPRLDKDTPLSKQDHRAQFAALGIGSLRENVGYFRIPARGLSRLLPGQSGEEVLLQEAKPGFLSFVTSRQREVPEEYATVLLGNNPEPPPHWQVITAFPGLPYEPERSGISAENDLGLHDGQRIILEDLQKILGRGDLLLQAG